MRRDNDRLEELVRLLDPVDEEQATSALDHQAKSAFAREIIRMPTLTEPRTNDVPTPRSPAFPRLTRPVLAALAILVFAITGLTVLLPPGGAPPAIAGWEPTPASVPADLVANVEAECTPPETAEPGEQLASFMNDPQLAAIDVRGNAAVAVFADDTQYVICNLVEEDENWNFSALQHGTFTSTDSHIAADAQQQWTYGETSITTLVGRVSPDVDHVTVEREDGMLIESTRHNGIFIAWWPSAHTATTVDAFGTDGELLGRDTEAPAGGFVNEF